MKAKIIIIGNEILNGFTKDTNAHFLINNLLKNDIIVDNVVFIKDEAFTIIDELNKVQGQKMDYRGWASWTIIQHQ